MLDALNLGVAKARHVIKAILLPELGETRPQAARSSAVVVGRGCLSAASTSSRWRR